MRSTHTSISLLYRSRLTVRSYCKPRTADDDDDRDEDDDETDETAAAAVAAESADEMQQHAQLQLAMFLEADMSRRQQECVCSTHTH